MNNKCIVRADFYPDGSINPLGITDKFGNTTYIKRVKKTIKVDDSEYIFECITDKKEIKLHFKNNLWCL